MSFTHYDFVLLVQDMRVAQKRYFKTRAKEALRESILIEAEVDSYIKNFFDNMH